MNNTVKTNLKILPIIVTICITLVIIMGIFSWIYIEKQQIAQQNRSLAQQKQLKEKELEAMKESARIEADGLRNAAHQSTCMPGDTPGFSC